MALNFPNTGLYEGLQYTGDNGVTYIFDGVKWVGHAPAGTAGTNAIINGIYTIQVDNGGNLVIPVGSTIIYEGGDPVVTGGATDRLTSSTAVVRLDSDNTLYLPGDDQVSKISFSEAQGAYIGQGMGTLELQTGPSAYLQIQTDGGNKQWQFGADGTLTLPNSAAISNTNLGFHQTFSTNGAGQNSSDTNSLTVGIANPAWADAILANPSNYYIRFGFDDYISQYPISGISGPNHPGTNVYTLTGTWSADGGAFPITISSNDYVANITTISSLNGAQIATAGGSWLFDSNGNLTIPVTGDITRDGVSAFGGGGAGGVFDMSYTYQAGSYLQTNNDPATPYGVFSSNSNLLNDTSDLVEDTDYLYISTFDANAKDVQSMFNWVADAGIGAQIRVTDPQGNQVARLVSDQIGWTSSTWNYYNGHQITVARMWGNGTPSKAKIMITQTQSQQFDGDYTTNSDWAQWSYSDTDHPMLFVLYGENSNMPIDITQLWNFATGAVDIFSSLATALDRRTAFYSQIDALITNSFPPGTLFEDFQFYNTNGTYFDGGTGGVTVNSPGGGNGAWFTVTWDFERYWVKRSGQRMFGGGTGYALGDSFVVQGDYFAANTRGVNGVNDLTITVTEIDGYGGIKRFTVEGVPPEPWWPTNNIDDGGADQEDNANYIYTNITGNNADEGHNRAAASGETLQAVPYNGGVVNSTEGFFTATGAPAGEYVVTYRNSVFALFVTGNTSTLLETDGNSGFDGASQMSWTGNPSVLGYEINVKVVEGGGSWVPGTKYNFTFDFNNALGNTKFFGDYILASPNRQINFQSWGGEGGLHIPRDTALGYNEVVLSNFGWTNNNVYENAGVTINIYNGQWTFRQDVQNPGNQYGTNNPYIQNPNNTRTVNPQNAQCAPNMDTIVYTSTADYVSAIKLFLMAEGTPDGAPYDNSDQWDTQATDAIVVHTPYNSATVNTPSITVYGRVYTGAGPVATFSVRRNSTTNRIEVLARPTSTTHYCYVRATVTEIMSQD